jgi:DNA polymerase III gamma/tau subunit
MLNVAPEDLPVIRTTAEKFSYSELLRIANLLLRDDETVNRAEHQRLAVEIALLKAGTFPRLRAVEEALAGGAAIAQAAPPRARAAAVEPKAAAPRETALPSSASATIESFIERVQKARPLIGGYLGAAKSRKRDGNKLLLTFADSFTADQVSNARAALEPIAAEVFGEPVTIDVQTDSPAAGAPAAKSSSPLRDDPIVQAFQKHLGADIVESRKR